VFGFSVLVVFLLMAALYESWTLPFAVLLATPIAMFGALGALWLRRFELDVFSQIGLLMVIGLAAKNAILIVEFAKVAYEQGMPLVAAALEGGCAIGPDYKRPTVAEPQTFRGQATAEAASLADAPWWEVFRDPILVDLIREALHDNYDVRIAAARVQEARANLSIARSDLYPSFDYSGGVSRSKVGPGIQGRPGGPVSSATN